MWDTIDEFGGGVSSGLPTDGDYNCVGVGDIDEDGNIDIVIGAEENYGSSGTKGLYACFGSGDGVWTQNTIKDTGSYASIEVKDCDNDGNNEVWACYQEYTNGVGAWEWTGSAFTTSGISSPHTSGAVSYVRIANISGKGGLDMVVASQNGMRYYEGNGASPISWTQYSTGLSTNGFFTGMDLTDLNNDGLLDIAAGQYGDGILLYQQSSAGRSWTDVSSTLPSVENSGRILGFVAGDVNGDGNTDLIYSRRTAPNGMFMLLGNGGGPSGNDLRWTYVNSSWTDQPDGTYYQMQLQDVDRDGDLDLLAPCEDYGLHLYLGNGADDPGLSFKWTEVTGKGLPANMKFFGGNYLDFDSDGDQDIAGCTWGNGAMMFRNNITQPENPTARAGKDMTIFLGNTTMLNGTGSSDAQDCPLGDIDGEILTYDWNLTSQPIGSTMTDADLFPSDDDATPSFAPTHAGNYTFTLGVADTDGHRSITEDSVRITVVLVNTAPTSDAGMDRTVHIGDNVTLDGSGSSDPEDPFELLTFAWEASPTNPASVVLSDNRSATPWFVVPSITGVYSFNLTVRDSLGAISDPDRIEVAVVLPPNQRPIANAGADIEAVANSTVTLNGSLSSDPDGMIANWSWECTTHPLLPLMGDDTAYPHFVPTRTGIYYFMLRVRDDRMEWSDPDTVTVDVSPDNYPPVANAGKNLSVHRNSTVVLNGSLSSDGDGSIIVWNWTWPTQPNITIEDADSPHPSFNASELGEAIFTLRVMDDDGLWSLPDTVKVTVVPEEEDITDPVENKPPTVDLIHPAGGTIINGTVRIAWTASDEDMDPLTVRMILYNAQGSPSSLFDGAMSVQYLDWNTSRHINGSYSIEIIVDDGEDEAFERSGTFQVRNEAPPANGTGDDPPIDPPIGPNDDDDDPLLVYLLFIGLVMLVVAILVITGIVMIVRNGSRSRDMDDWGEE
jgi:hypothetical protein